MVKMLRYVYMLELQIEQIEYPEVDGEVVLATPAAVLWTLFDPQANIPVIRF